MIDAVVMLAPVAALATILIAVALTAKPPRPL
jgi:hypothetical protein